MNLLSGMKIYTVHIPTGVSDPQEKAVFVREGFSIYAFFFHFLWAFYHRLWFTGTIILAVYVGLSALEKYHVINQVGLALLQVAVAVIVGFHAHDWRRSRLARQGYVLTDVTASDSQQRAEQRYFERMFPATH
jgi:hypothetical protein